MPKNTQKHRYFVPLIALALVMGVMGLFALACSSGSSPTEPAAPVGAEGATASTSSLGGAPIEGAHIDIEKSTNGEDADQGPGPEIVVGNPVTWEYVITNTGSVKLTHITLKDDQIGNIKCPEESLDVGESMTCKATGKAKLGDYENVGRVRAWAPDKSEIGAKDHSHYLGVKSTGKPKIRIEKSTNGEDADEAPGPEIVVGDPVTWEYVVTNTGDVPLTDISVRDNQLGEITSCPSTALEPGESMTCKADGVAELGQYRNVGRVKGTAPDKTEVGDKDDSHYLGVESGGKANIRIEKSTNGEDADSPTGPEIPVGAPVHWEYVVTNTGDVPLSGISVTDDQIGAIVCPSTTLEPGESMTCMAEGIAEDGQYKNVGRVVAKDPDGNEVADKDPSHYFGKEEETGFEGCSHGYWKNHLGSWVPTGYSPGQTVKSVFEVPASISHLGDATLLEALQFGGGPGVEGAAKNLLRQAVGALLNADHPGVAFPMSETEVINAVNTALASENRHTILSVKDDMDSDNNLGCPLN